MAEMTSKQLAGAALDLIMSVRGYVDADVSSELERRGVNMSRSSVQAKRTGGSFTLSDIDTFAELFEVPRQVFCIEPDELWKWIGDNRPEWTRDFAATAGRRRVVRSRCDSRSSRRSIPGQMTMVFDEDVIDLTIDEPAIVEAERYLAQPSDTELLHLDSVFETRRPRRLALAR